MPKSDILITGAAGSIGTELFKQLIAREPSVNIICIDNNETGLFELQQQYKAVANRTKFIVADLANERWKFDSRLKNIEITYHAAAFKHVGLSHTNELYYFLNNVGGMLRVLEFAKENASGLVLISTDKAVYPSNAMGCTKRLCEFLMLASKMQNFMAVRFGNVLNSNGSVIPIFKRQIKMGGPVTVTTPGTTRFFMSLNEAIGLIFNSQRSQESNGKIKILDMGPAITINSLAKNMIKEAGLTVVSEGMKKLPTEIEIKYIGLRPGEKEHEVLTYGALEIEENIQNANEEIIPCPKLIAHIIDCEKNDILPNFQAIDWKNGCLL